MRRILGLLAISLACWGADPTITEILGRPTKDSITVNARANADLELYYEYGPASQGYDSKTEAVTASANEPVEVLLSGLTGDTRYSYRIRYRETGSDGEFAAGTEHTFVTQRAPGRKFVFGVQGDSHPERDNNMFNSELYNRTMDAVAKERPDFYITSGDDFSVDTLNLVNKETVTGRYTLQIPYFSRMAHSTPLFLTNGNHEQAAGYLYDGTPDCVPVWAQAARNRFFPQPAPDGFYTGNGEEVEHIGLLRNYYAWEWGDALFAVIDPYWPSTVPVDNVFGNDSRDNATNGRTQNKWEITHGETQYQWLKQTLENSRAKWKFVFAHHVIGTGRGAIEAAPQFEWGGQNANGSWGFTANRPTWAKPIHQLFVDNKVTIFFQGHDHLFARQELDGVIYQSLPNPADNTYTAFNADAYRTGVKFPNAGYVKVTVDADSVAVEYIRMFLPRDEKPPSQVSGMVQYSYRIPK